MSPESPDDYRTAAEHDVDRLLYSSAFRRLDGVTQVVAIGERLQLHNRLTHTLKVAQLSRRIAQWVNHTNGRVVANPSVAEAAGLAHDIGHPPFGHIAERALNGRLEQYDVGGFEGNAQSFRIVTKLSQTRVAGESGLRLSSQTLNGILKYPWMSDHENAGTKHKWGAYVSEAQDFAIARAGDRSTAKSVEAEIMDWADDISYAVHDLQDFYSAGMIPLGGLQSSGTLRADFVAKAREEWHEDWELTDEAADHTLKELFFLLALTSAEPGTVRHRSEVSRMGGTLINRYVSAARVEDDVFTINRSMREQIFLLKQLTWQHVIQHPSLASLQRGQVNLVTGLFDMLFDWVSDEKKLQRVPTRLHDLMVFAERDVRGTDEAKKARAISDFICVLTEDQAVDLHDRLAGSIRGTIQDRWLAS